MINIFGNDLVDVVVVNTEQEDIDLESIYTFVKCRNYINYIDKLIDSRMIFDVLGGYKNPDVVSDTEIADFTSSVECLKDKELKYGDVVLIKNGYLKNIYGVITKLAKKRYEVLFKLYTRCFIKKMNRENLIHGGENIFDKVSNLK